MAWSREPGSPGAPSRAWPEVSGRAAKAAVGKHKRSKLKLHLWLQALSTGLASAGAYAIYENETRMGKPHFTTLHGKLGLATVVGTQVRKRCSAIVLSSLLSLGGSHPSTRLLRRGGRRREAGSAAAARSGGREAPTAARG